MLLAISGQTKNISASFNFNDISMILTTFLIGVAIGIVIGFIIKNRKKNVHARDSAALIDEYSSSQYRFNNMIDEFNALLKTKYQDVMDSLDTEAIHCFSSQRSVFENAYTVCSRIFKDVDKLNKTINKKSSNDRLLALIEDSLEKLNTSLDEMETSLYAIRTIDIKNVPPKEKKVKIYKKETDFFTGCVTKDQVSARYRALSKAFHPDNKSGSESLFKTLQRQYKSIQ